MVTLAGYLFLSGALIFLIDSTGSIGNGGVIRLNSNILNDIEAGALGATASWIVMIALVLLAGVMMYLRDHRRRSNGLVAAPLSVTLLKVAAIAVAGVVVVLVGNSNRAHCSWPCADCPGSCWWCWASWSSTRRFSDGPDLAVISTRSAAMPRRPAGRASTPTGSRWRRSRCAA